MRGNESLRAGRGVPALVEEIRRRWRRSVILRGGALTLIVALALLTVVLIVVTSVAIQRPHLIASLAVASLLVVGVAYVFIVRPLRRQPTDRQLAMFVEERVPGLQDRLNSAVEVAPLARTPDDGSLFEQIVRDAVAHARDIQPSTVVDQRRERFLGVAAATLFVAFLVFGYQVRDRIQISRTGLNVIGVAMTAEVTVFPGDAEIEKGASQEFIVRLRNDRQSVALLTRADGGQWERHDMIRGIDEDAVYLFELSDIQDPLDYFIEYGEDRTDVFRITLYEFPSVAQIDVTYRYPQYTGLANSFEENGGDLEALVGTRASVSVSVGGAPESGRLVFDDGHSTPLVRSDDGSFTGVVEITRDGSYHVALEDAAGKQNRFPVEYAVIALEDQPPVVEVTEPRRDLRVNAIQEVLLAAEARDDFGTSRLTLHYSVNGEEERTFDLAPDATDDARELSGEHLLYLEDYSLSPGDVISYYASAADRRPGGEPSATDMYFIEVIPFDQQYTQVNNAGGLGGGGNQQGGIVLSQQEIIAATWRLQREQSRLAGADFGEMLDGIVQAQENLRSSIEERISSTAFSRELLQDDASRAVVGHLRDAIGEMSNAVEVLRSRDLKRALTPERKALNHLLKADALNTEQEVAINRGGGAAGGGGAVQERISELMDLELDISKDKYETQQQRSAQQRAQSTDDALNKIKELARRQQDLAEEGQRQTPQDSEERRRFIDRLKREQDELRRQTEELSRSMNGQSSASSEGSAAREASERVADEMERAEEALRRGDVEEAMAHQQRALNELQRLQRDLQASSNQGARERVDELGREFDELRREEERLAEELSAETERIRESGGNPARSRDRERLESLQNLRAENVERLERLTEGAQDLEADLRDEDPSAASTLRNMLQRMRREDVEQNMNNSGEALRQGWLDFAERTQQEILDTLERMEEQRRALDDMLPPDDEERIARSLRDTRDLQEAIEAIERETDRLAELRARGEGEAQGSGQQGGQGREAQTSEARIERELERARQAIERLQEGFSGDARARAQLDRLSAFVNRADHTGVLLEGEAAEAFFNEQAFDPLSELEMTLARQLDEIELEKKLYGTRQADVPPEYRRLIDDYYEALSKDNN